MCKVTSTYNCELITYKYSVLRSAVLCTYRYLASASCFCMAFLEIISSLSSGQRLCCATQLYVVVGVLHASVRLIFCNYLERGLVVLGVFKFGSSRCREQSDISGNHHLLRSRARRRDPRDKMTVISFLYLVRGAVDYW
jgi:hypothetical protein